MAIGNDGSAICELCAGQFWAGIDPLIEVWPRWISGPWGDRMYDPGFHVCAACLRAMFAEQYANELVGMGRARQRAA